MEEDEKDKIKLNIVYQNETKTTPIFPTKFINLTLLFNNIFNIKKDDKIYYYTYLVKTERKLEDKNTKIFEEQMARIKAQENPTIYVWDSNEDYQKFMYDDTILESKYCLDFNLSNITTSSIYPNDDINELKENFEKVENETKKISDKINSEIKNINALKEEIEFFNDINDEKMHNNFHELKDKIKMLQNENDTIKEKNKFNIDNLIEENNKLKKQLEENENLNNKIKELENQLTKTTEENKELKNKLEINNKSYEEEINKIKEDRDCYINAFENKENEIKNINKILSEIQEKLKIKEEELSKKDKKENDMKKKIENYKQKINELKETFNKKIKELEENIDNNI